MPVEYGVKDYVTNYDVIWANNLPFLKLLGFTKILKPKKLSYISIPKYLIVTGGILLFGLYIYFISIESNWTINEKLGLFTLTFLGTIANGGVSEKRKWGVYLWLFNFLFFSPVFIYSFKMYEPILMSILVLLAINSVISFVKMGRQMKSNNH